MVKYRTYDIKASKDHGAVVCSLVARAKSISLCVVLYKMKPVGLTDTMKNLLFICRIKSRTKALVTVQVTMYSKHGH